MELKNPEPEGAACGRRSGAGEEAATGAAGGAGDEVGPGAVMEEVVEDGAWAVEALAGAGGAGGGSGLCRSVM